jgi:ABC-type transport system involved in multi-copper enzyme maturation permease subunit
MTTPPLLPDPLQQASPDWRRAFGGVWRLTYPRSFSPANLGILAGLTGLLALIALSALRSGSAENFAQWSVNFYLMAVVPVVAFLTAAGLVRDDLKSATVDYVLTRPVRRPAYVLYRYLSHTACLQAQCLLTLAVLVAVGVFRQVPGLATAGPLLLLAQVLAVMAFSALGFAFGAYTSRYLIIGIVYANIIEMGVGNIPTQLNRLSMTHHVRTVASGLLRQQTGGPAHTDSLFVATCALVLFSLIFLTLAAVLFSLREATGAKPKES